MARAHNQWHFSQTPRRCSDQRILSAMGVKYVKPTRSQNSFDREDAAYDVDRTIHRHSVHQKTCVEQTRA